jgi:diguanylate cyclase (GGDEF)-like protein
MINLKKSSLKIFIIYSIFICFFSKADENANFDGRLSLADNIRSSNPQRFSELIIELNLDKDALSIPQAQHLKYLNTYFLMFQGKLEKAISLATEISQSDANETLKYRAKLSLMNIYANMQNWSDGLTNLSSLLKDLPSIKNDDYYQLALVSASMFYNQLGQHQLALSYANQISIRPGQNRNNCLAKGFIVEALSKSQKLSLSDPIIEQAINVCKINNEMLMVSFIHSYIARVYLHNEQYTDAVNFLNSTLQPAIKTNFSRIIAEHYSLLANAHWHTKNFIKAKQYALKTLESKGQLSSKKAKTLAHLLLYKVSKHNNNSKLALSYFEIYSELDKEHLNGEKAKHLAFQLAEHQALEQESQIRLLNEQNNSLAAEQALAKIQADNRKLVIVLLSIIILVLAILGTRLWRTHKRVKELAEYDPLTGILNRGHFTQLTQSALKYCQSAEQDLSVIMFDLDHFKKINDRFGHICGDWALKQVTKACDRIGRKNDIFARLGGEEFCIVLPSCNIDVAILRAEACRAAIEAIITEQTGCEFTITASFGVTDVKRSGFDLDMLLANSDMAAYASKHAGRNRVTIHQIPDNDSEKTPTNTWDYN